jgi:hypothetical protein
VRLLVRVRRINYRTSVATGRWVGRFGKAMPRYFFHLYQAAMWPDERGRELPDDDAAWKEAVDTAREIACADVSAGQLNLTHRIEIEDESGRLITAVRFADVIKVET